MIFFEEEQLNVRSLEPLDKAFLVKWLSDEMVLEFYEGRDRVFDEAMVERKFYTPKPKERCIIEYHRKPVGYLQFYQVETEESYGIDMFIGETKLWGQGLGTLILQKMVRFLTEERNAQRVTLDPRCRNGRAIRCYEKSGFRKVKLLPKNEFFEGEWQDCWLMEYTPVK